MATSSLLDEYRDKLRDINFWLNGYRHTLPYNSFLYTAPINSADQRMCWNVGVGPTCSFTRAISGISVVEFTLRRDPSPVIIKVDLDKPEAPVEDDEEAQLRRSGMVTMSIKYQLPIALAKELGMLDEDPEYHRIKKNYADEQYYSYWLCDIDAVWTHEFVFHIANRIIPRIYQRLSGVWYVLLLENLKSPIEPVSVAWDAGLPPPRWTDSYWIMSTTSRDVYDKSRTQIKGTMSTDGDDDIVVLIVSALRQSCKHIFDMIHQETEEYWYGIALRCFHYAMTIFSKYSMQVVTSDELIHRWAAQGILPHIKEQETTGTYSSKCGYMHKTGRVILEAFHDYSLLQLPFSPTDVPTKTATHFLAYHGLIAEDITVDIISDIDKKNWISFVGDNGWHVSRKWLSQEETCRGPTSLTLRGCSHQSLILSKLDCLLSTLIFLRVLDLSYTPLKSLPSSIGCLLNLRLLSLRGCHDLETLSSPSTTSTTYSARNSGSYSPLSSLVQLEILDMNGVPISHLTQDMVNQKSNLIYLDMSYSKVTTFPHNFFHGMSNLEELILVNCSNLVELPPSMAALSSLTTLEVTGTQIRYFPKKIFDEMQKLQSLMLIDNKKLISLPRSISMAHGLFHLHIEGGDSIMEEIKLEGHPTLISFLLIGAPHIRRLSLHRCRKLESVKLKNLGALEELNLSATAIKELPADIPNLPQLRSLLLMGVPSLRRFPWHKLERLPDVFCLDHCVEGNGNHTNGVSQVYVTDSMFFYSFRDRAMNLVKNGNFFQLFYVQVAPCIANTRQWQDDENMLDNKLQVFVQRQSTYLDVYTRCIKEQTATMSPTTTPFRRTKRHVEISGMQQITRGLFYLLNVTKSISVTCDTSIESLSFLSNFNELEECELHWCHHMEKVFFHDQHLKCLRNVHVSSLKTLYHFCSQYNHYTFSALEHLHLENCPRLEDMMPHATALPRLKMLAILFCYNLKTIMHVPDGQQVGTYQLPSLQKIRLHELPLLQHFQNTDDDMIMAAPMWKELHVRGCWSLRRLPRLQDQLKAVKVSGERIWWGKLHWASPLHHDSYEPKLPQEFASFNEHAKMSSYLR